MSPRTFRPDLAAWLASLREAFGPGQTDPGMVRCCRFRPVFFRLEVLPFSAGVYT